MWIMGSRRRVVIIGLTTTKVLVVDVGRRNTIHHGGVAVDLPRVVEVRWRRKVHGLADGRVLNVVLSEQGLLTSLKLEELLINVLPMGTNFLCIVSSHVEASKKTLREKIEDTHFLAGGDGASRCGWPTRGGRWLKRGWATGGGATCGRSLSMLPLLGLYQEWVLSGRISTPATSQIILKIQGAY
jgi:hypothetical protein